jgi:Fe2+ transport system protein FeoA
MKSDFNFNTVTLDGIGAGRDVVVVRVDVDGPAGRRLLDLGLLPETPMRVIRRAPLGDPVVYELRGYRLCLRRSEASRVWVRAVSDDRNPTG